MKTDHYNYKAQSMKKSCPKILALATFLVAFLNTMLAQSPTRDFKWEPFQFQGEKITQKTMSHHDNPAGMLLYAWGNNATWDTVSRYTYSYSPNADLTTQLQENYLGGQFVPKYQWIIQYDANHAMIEMIKQKRLGGSWVNEQRQTKTFDASGNNTTIIYYDWYGTIWDTADGSSRNTYVYDSQNHVTNAIFESWSHSIGWGNNFMEDIHYNSLQVADTVILSYWNWDQMAWLYWDRFIDFTYYNPDVVSAMTMQAYDSLGNWNTYMRSTKTFSQYDSYQIIWETYNGTWALMAGALYTNDQYDHQIQFDSYDWTGVWTHNDGNKDLYIYDSQGHTIEDVYQVWNGQGYGNWYKKVYAGYFVGNESTENAGISIYPNPFSNHLLIHNGNHDLLDVQLYDAQGRLVLRGQVGLGDSEWDGSTLADGFYVYRMADAAAHHVKSGRLVKR